MQSKSSAGLTIKHNHILLGQSNNSGRTLICDFLVHADYKVYELIHASEIIQKCQSTPVDAILLDINLPGLKTCSAQLCRFAKASHIPIIIISEPEHLDIKNTFDLGADDYVLQPIQQTELLIRLKTLLRTAELKRQFSVCEARQAAMLHQSPAGIAFTDIDFNVLKTNSRFFRQYGYNEDIQTLSNILQQSSLEKYQTMQGWLTRLMQHGHIECELKTRHKNGTNNWTFIRGNLIDRNVPEQGLVWTLNDISEHKKTQEHLTLAARVFEVSGEAMIIMDKHCIINNSNPALSKLTGYQSSELQDHAITELLDFPNKEQSIWDNLDLTNKQWQGEFWVKKKNGQKTPVRGTLNDIKQPNGSISHFVMLLVDITAHKKQEKALRHRANHDSLTGLPNRNLFFVRLNEALAIAKRQQYDVALLYLDLDGFKPINDTLGHGKGDEVLQDVAHKLRHCVREVDTVARLGGDEFAIILNGTSEDLVTTTAKRLIDTLSINIENDLYLSVSIGIAMFPTDTLNPLKLLQLADKAMYKAKQNGKHTFCWHSSHL